MAVFPTHTLYLGSQPRYINSRLEHLVTHFSISSTIDLRGDTQPSPSHTVNHTCSVTKQHNSEDAPAYESTDTIGEKNVCLAQTSNKYHLIVILIKCFT